jgi:hypothetical protein
MTAAGHRKAAVASILPLAALVLNRKTEVHHLGHFQMAEFGSEPYPMMFR